MKKSIILTIITTILLSITAPICGFCSESNILVTYFSCTGSTEGIANHIQNILGGDIYEIEPEIPYTSADLNYNNSTSRANLEQNDPSARPAISGGIDNLEDYDVIFLGYPIWWGQAPKIIYTFLESYDFSGKLIIPFCTSGSSGIGSSASNLHSLTSDTAVWNSGRRFSGGSSEATVKAWTDTLELPAPSPKISVSGGTVTASNAPENSTLITAFYSNRVLIDVNLTQGSGTISANISNPLADTVKAFLWDMETIAPLAKTEELLIDKSDEMLVKISSSDTEVVYKLNESQAAKDLYAQLPLTVNIEDYNNNEKIFYPPNSLNTTDAPKASGGRGALAYYASWGDVVLFYDIFNENSSLFSLGEAVLGAEFIENLSGSVTISPLSD